MNGWMNERMNGYRQTNFQNTILYPYKLLVKDIQEKDIQFAPQKYRYDKLRKNAKNNDK